MIYITNGPFGTAIFEKLLQKGYKPSLLITGEDVAKGRGKKILPPQSKLLAEEYHIPVYQTSNINDEFTHQIIRQTNTNIALLCDFGQILRKKTLTLFEKGVINIHPSLLPQYRGSAPIRRAMMNGDRKTGVTWMKMVRKLDAGPILYVYTQEIEECMTYDELFTQLVDVSAQYTLDIMDDYINDKIIPAQQEGIVSYADKITKEELRINWNIDSNRLINMINALSPSPGAWTLIEGRRLKILKACYAKIEEKISVGEMQVINKSLYVGCKDGAIEIFKLQLEGKKVTESKAFINGMKDTKIILE